MTTFVLLLLLLLFCVFFTGRSKRSDTCEFLPNRREMSPEWKERDISFSLFKRAFYSEKSLLTSIDGNERSTTLTMILSGARLAFLLIVECEVSQTYERAYRVWGRISKIANLRQKGEERKWLTCPWTGLSVHMRCMLRRHPACEQRDWGSSCWPSFSSSCLKLEARRERVTRVMPLMQMRHDKR